ncbi:alpha-crystallin B chain-like [Uloborus diversus]|uniref:alpha-crystallin B chain-like n=1 Tax=Uloborus diversus TaxID=327109 RepID=UPI00240A31A0|nr:alpha-crystallin B chain-like [Uloborus diversus]
MAAAGPAREADWYTNLEYNVVLLDQCFVRVVKDEDLYPSHYYYQTYAFRPLTQQFYDSSGISRVTDNEDKFHVELDARNFLDQEIDVSVINAYELEISGMHHPRDDGCGLVSRMFLRRYYLPYGVGRRFDRFLSDDGILNVCFQKDFKLTDSEEVPITDGAQGL